MVLPALPPPPPPPAVANHLELRAAAVVDPHAVAALAPAPTLDARCVGLLLHEPRAPVDRQLALAVAVVLRRAVELEALRRRLAAAPAEAVQAHVAAARLDEAGAVGHSAPVSRAPAPRAASRRGTARNCPSQARRSRAAPPRARSRPAPSAGPALRERGIERRRDQRAPRAMQPSLWPLFISSLRPRAPRRPTSECRASARRRSSPPWSASAAPRRPSCPAPPRSPGTCGRRSSSPPPTSSASRGA